MTAITTPDELYGELFEAVQASKLLGDSKTFVDVVPLHDPVGIVENYLAQRDQEGFDLLAFVAANFRVPGHQGKGEVGADASVTVRQHIESMWDTLTRDRDEEEPYSSLLPLPRPYVVPGGRFREIYYWDSYFTMLGLAADGHFEMIENMVANFAFLIDRVGFIPNGNRTYYCTRSQPPFFALMLELLSEVSRDDDVYVKYLPQLQREYEFWMRGAEVLDVNNAASGRVVLVDDVYLNRYWDDSVLPRQESYEEDVLLATASDRPAEEFYRDIRAGAESGWDYTSRWLADGRHLATIQTTNVIPVDLNSLMVRLEQVLARASELAGDTESAERYDARAQARAGFIRGRFFCTESGFFKDLELSSLERLPMMSLAAAAPLFFGVATIGQAERVVDLIHARFLKPGGWVTTLDSTGEQWDSPNGWAPLQWVVYKGLSDYGYQAQAEEGARRWIACNAEVFNRHGMLMEKYDVEQVGTIAGGGEYEVQDGFGWTNGVLAALMDELGPE